MIPRSRLVFLGGFAALVVAACGCWFARPHDLHLAMGARFETEEQVSDLSVAAMHGDSVLAIWTARPPASRPYRPIDGRLYVAASHDGQRWDRIAFLDSTSGDETRLIRTPTHSYVFFRRHGGLFRLEPDLSRTLVNAVDLPGGHDNIGLDAAVIEPDSVLVAYSTWQLDTRRSLWHHLILLGHWQLGGGLARLDTVAVYPVGVAGPLNVQLAVVAGRPLILAEHLPPDSTARGGRWQLESDQSAVVSLYSRQADGSWRSSDLEYDRSMDARWIECLAKGDSLCLLFNRRSTLCERTLDIDRMVGQTIPIGESWAYVRHRNDWVPGPTARWEGPGRGPVAWIRFVDPGEMYGPLSLALLPLMMMGADLSQEHPMLTCPGVAGSRGDRDFDLCRLARVPSGSIRAVAASGTNSDGVILTLRQTYRERATLLLMRYHLGAPNGADPELPH